jgi:hypothetical protein
MPKNKSYLTSIMEYICENEKTYTSKQAAFSRRMGPTLADQVHANHWFQ